MAAKPGTPPTSNSRATVSCGCAGRTAGTRAKRARYHLMSRATDEVGRVQSHEPRYNNMRKNFSAIVGYWVTVA